uniref:Uncharacterized protein n=1 Tax=Physcomitrium patens TaxID=3218 RepID=A0A2K1IUH8_PHYPA|nr:hypothetical protein PHYPA_024875 [Physcomitrium patens]
MNATNEDSRNENSQLQTPRQGFDFKELLLHCQHLRRTTCRKVEVRGRVFVTLLNHIKIFTSQLAQFWDVCKIFYLDGKPSVALRHYKRMTVMKYK